MRKIIAAFCFILCVCVQAVYSAGQSNPTPQSSNPWPSVNDALSNMDTAQAQNPEPSEQDKYYLGRSVAANILTVYKPYTGSPELTRYLNLICQTLVVNTPQLGLYNGCHVLMLDSSELNAFASPGGHIFITRAFVELATSEDMLAAIIAHELAHILLNHGMSVVSSMRFQNDMTAVANRALTLSGGDTDAARFIEFRDSVTAMMDALIKSGYSQTQEYEADREALMILAASGYDPRALSDLLRAMQSVQGARNTAISATHPSAGERIANIERQAVARIPDTRSYRVSRFINK